MPTKNKTVKDIKTITWKNFPQGAVIDNPGNANAYKTGDWRSAIPVTDKEKCTNCTLCWIFCPDMARYDTGEGYYDVNPEYCKGCGICAKECPPKCITMVDEKV